MNWEVLHMNYAGVQPKFNTEINKIYTTKARLTRNKKKTRVKQKRERDGPLMKLPEPKI